MNGKINSDMAHDSTVYVLENHTPDDVARAMIESGCQREPFYIFDMDEAYRRIQHFKSVMPRVKIFYAMKSNDSEFLLKLAIASQLGFDCASPEEILKVRKLNVNPLSIIYAMPSKTPAQMEYARDSGISHTTFDSSFELKKIKQYWPDARLLIRLRVDADCIYKLGEKFGCDFDTEATQLLDEAAHLGLRIVGVAFHVGSACSSVDSHVTGLRYAKALFDYEARAGRKMYVVDIGGGFLSDRMDRVDEVAIRVNKALDEYFRDEDVQVIAEPGRYISESSFTLYCNIYNVKQVTKNNEAVNMIYINDGLFGTLRYNEPWYTVKKFKISREKENETSEKPVKTILWGPSCDSTDRIMQDVNINLSQCTPYDWLVFSNQGAYTFVFASNFSRLPLPKIRSVLSLQLWNVLKKNEAFRASDFTTNPDIASPLPSLIPRVVPKNAAFYYVGSPLLKL